MPWQAEVALVGGEYDLDAAGRILPVYREVIVTVPRQNGKTLLMLTWESDRALNWGVRQRILYTAQTGKDGRAKLLTEQWPDLYASGLRPALERCVRAKGEEAIVWRNGSRIEIESGAEASGHGQTLHLGVLDETWNDADDRREQAVVPALNTVDDGQILNVSTRGTAASTYHNRKVAQGRALVESNVNSGVAYFEWSAEPDADPDDPDVWRSCMPALGHTINERVVRHARSTMELGEFKRAYLNIPTDTVDTVIPATAWRLVCDASAVADGSVVLGLDATEDRTRVAIVKATRDVVEVVEHRAGAAWVVPELLKRKRLKVAVDPAGPAGVFVADLERAGVQVLPVAGREMAQACAAFFDGVADRTFRARTDPDLDAAVAGAVKRTSGDVWTWQRNESSAPLVAATVALWTARQSSARLFVAVT